MVQTADKTIEEKVKAFEAELRDEMGLGAKSKHFKKPIERPFTKNERESTTILWGGLTVAHEQLMTAAVEHLGYKVQPLPVPDNDSLQVGKEYGNRGQCNPTYYTVGNLVKHLKILRDEQGIEDIEDKYVFVTAGACGPCRFGMYEAEYRKALKEADFQDFRVLLWDQNGGLKQTSGQEGPGLELNGKFFMQMLKGMIAGDLLNAVVYKIRPYEVNPGETNRVLEESKELVADALRRGVHVVLALRKVRKKLEKIEVDYTRVKPKVKITGEFWAQTTEGDGNYKVFSWLESEGAEVKVEPVGTWIEYLIFSASHTAEEKVDIDPNAKKLIRKLKVAKAFVRVFYNSYRAALGFKTDPLPSQAKLAQYARAYYNTHLKGGEGHLEIGKNIMATKEHQAHMVISMKPFGCMPSTQSDGVQSKVVADFKDAIYIPIETSGDGEVNVKSRMQMKLYEAKMKAREELQKILDENDVTMEEIGEFVAENPKLGRAMRNVPHEAASTAANFVADIAHHRNKARNGGTLRHWKRQADLAIERLGMGLS